MVIESITDVDVSQSQLIQSSGRLFIQLSLILKVAHVQITPYSTLHFLGPISREVLEICETLTDRQREISAVVG